MELRDKDKGYAALVGWVKEDSITVDQNGEDMIPAEKYLHIIGVALAQLKFSLLTAGHDMTRPDINQQILEEVERVYNRAFDAYLAGDLTMYDVAPAGEKR